MTNSTIPNPMDLDLDLDFEHFGDSDRREIAKSLTIAKFSTKGIFEVEL